MKDESLSFPRSSRWVGTLMPILGLTVYGLPRQSAGEQLELWRGHLELINAEHGKVHATLHAVTSFFSQLAWRVAMGPASALLPGIALLGAGFASAVIAFSRPNNFVADIAIFIAATFLGTTLVRHPRVQPRTQLAIGSGLCVPALLVYSASIASDIWIRSDWFIALGTAVIGVGMALVSLGASPLRFVSVELGRSWGFGLAALGAGSISVAELDWLRQWDGTVLLIAKLVAAIGTLAIAFTAWRIREVPQKPEQPFDISNQIERF